MINRIDNNNKAPCGKRYPEKSNPDEDEPVWFRSGRKRIDHPHTSHHQKKHIPALCDLLLAAKINVPHTKRTYTSSPRSGTDTPQKHVNETEGEEKKKTTSRRSPGSSLTPVVNPLK
jgi:hypothetical protein